MEDPDQEVDLVEHHHKRQGWMLKGALIKICF